MFKGLILLISAVVIVGCDNDGTAKVKIDSLGKKFDSSAQRLYDSAKEKGREIKDHIKDKLENKDSAH